MYVYLVQHGESKSEEEDPQRRLTDKGIGEVQNVADFLRPLKLAVDAIWHSDKARAQQTGELLAGAVMARDGLVQREGLGPKDQVASKKELLEQTGSDLMIVGHLPFLGKLVALLVTGSEKNEIVEFQFGSVVCIERRDDGKWKVVWKRLERIPAQSFKRSKISATSCALFSKKTSSLSVSPHSTSNEEQITPALLAELSLIIKTPIFSNICLALGVI